MKNKLSGSEGTLGYDGEQGHAGATGAKHIGKTDQASVIDELLDSQYVFFVSIIISFFILGCCF